VIRYYCIVTRLSRIVYVFLSLLLIWSCKKEFEGDRDSIGLPETYTVVDSVHRDSVNHYLVTTVHAYWWGSAAKGFIKGFEVSTDDMQTWKYTTLQEGTFLLQLPVGQKSGIIPIYVRAIDNLGNKDATPAQMVFPVVNTRPSLYLDANKPTPDKSFPIIKFNWQAADIDGLSDIDHYELVLNQNTDSTRFMVLPGSISDELVNDTTCSASIRIEGIRSGATFTNEAQVFQGNKTVALSGVLKDLKLDSLNIIWLRAIDRTGNKSVWIKDSLVVNVPKSDVLLVNAMYNNALNVQNFYINTLAKPLVGVSSVQTLRGVNSSLNGASELYTDALTQQRTFNLFKKIIWLTDDPNTLATAQLTTGEFFNNGGKMFIHAQIGDDFPVNSQVFGFTPISSLVNPASDTTIVNGRFRMDNTCIATPFNNTWPSLGFSGPITAARPFFTNTTSTAQFSYDSIMTAKIKIQSSSGSPVWNGPSVTMSKRIRISAGKADIILSTLPLQYMNANNNIDSLFKKIFIDELSF